ncbi:MAG TPA: hypothetical protein VF572_04880 [Candidatus Saccharimonadales bacterium]|jgi:hypothetical protein
MSDSDTPTAASAQAAPSHIPLPSKAQRWKWLLGGVLLGALLLLAVRFVTYHEDHTHYHANFAVYIDGTRESFAGQEYYQEVKICDMAGVSPLARTHMHDEESGVVHVHDKAVTWGQFFQNLGWNIGTDFISTPDKLYQASDASKLNIILNDQDLTDLTTITNQVIDDRDRLLVSYGPADSAELQKQYRSVPSDAASYNEKDDPASCGGGETPTVKERLRHLL